MNTIICICYVFVVLIVGGLWVLPYVIMRWLRENPDFKYSGKSGRNREGDKMSMNIYKKPTPSPAGNPGKEKRMNVNKAMMAAIQAAYDRLGWATLSVTLKSLNGTEEDKKDDGYNLFVYVEDAHVLVEGDGYLRPAAPTTIGVWPDDTVYVAESYMRLEHCIHIRGKCGYGSRVRGYYFDERHWSIKFKSTGGHWVRMGWGCGGVQVECDSQESQASWGDAALGLEGEKLSFRREESIRARIK